MSLDTTYEFGHPPQQVTDVSGNRRRQLNDIRIVLDNDAAWCDRCRRIESAELLPTVSELREKLAKLKTQLRNRRRELAEAKRVLTPHLKSDAVLLKSAERDVTGTQKVLTVAKKELAWRRCRRSPPRCLQCGSTEIQYICPDGKPMLHPDGLGMIRFVGQCFSNYIHEYIEGEDVEDHDFGEQVYDSEGLRLDGRSPQLRKRDSLFRQWFSLRLRRERQHE